MDLDILDKVGNILFTARANFSRNIFDVVLLCKSGKYKEANTKLINARLKMYASTEKIVIMLTSLTAEEVQKEIEQVVERNEERTSDDKQTSLEM